MNRLLKISLAACVAVAGAFAAVIFGPVLAMVVLGSYASLVIGMTSDSAFEDEFMEIPEVGIFAAEYPGYSTSHTGDFLGWKVIMYRSDGVPTAALHVQKNVLHQGVRISAGCDYGTGTFAFDVPQEVVADYIRDRACGMT